MMMIHTHSAKSARRGVVLLVVLILLTMFAVVGIGFVQLSEQTTVTAGFARDSQVKDRPDPDALFAFFMNRIIFDSDESASALRGHSLLANVYGRDITNGNTVPFTGVGRLHTTSDPMVAPHDSFFFLNHQGARAPNNPRYGSWNPPWTYPDHHTAFLGAMNASGEILIQSFRRRGPYNFDPYGTPAFWTNQGFQPPGMPAGVTLSPAQKRAMVLRPIPWDTQVCMPGNRFPAPEDEGGDVRNVAAARGYRISAGVYARNDSYWVDANFPIQVGADGRRYKALPAFFILDLDGRVNLNVHGNVMRNNAGTRSHAGNQGLGRWEVNLGQVMNPIGVTAASTEWQNLLLGANGVAGRYGADRQPRTAGGSATALSPIPPHYSLLDFDGRNNTGAGASGKYNLPGAGGAVPYRAFPAYPADYGNGQATPAPGELANHPSLENFFNQTGTDDTVFGAWNMDALLRHGDTGADSQYSLFRTLAPSSFGTSAQAARIRQMVTTHSFDTARPAVMPFIHGNSPYKLGANPANGSLYDQPPGGAAIAFPTPTAPTQQPGAPTNEFASTWRYNNAPTTKLDLDRSLAAYPVPGANGRIANVAAFNTAQSARQTFAREIYDRLRIVTGAADTTTVAATSPEADALRWLAQLSVNMVDYIDSDDYMTPFTFSIGPVGAVQQYTVYGTELPRVVLNEAYIEETPSDINGIGIGLLRNHPSIHDLYVELHNPVFRDPNLSDNGAARLKVPDAGMGQPIYGVYQIVIAKPTRYLRDRNNLTGDYDDPANPNDGAHVTFDRAAPRAAANSPAAIMDFTDTPDTSPDRIEPNDPAATTANFSGPNGGNTRFYVVGPTGQPFPGGNVNSTHQSPMLTYRGFDIPGMVGQPRPAAEPPTLVLRRLACPHLRPNFPGMTGNYAFDLNLPLNPYITVDYIENVRVNQFRDQNGMGNGNAHLNNRSIGKQQPYASFLARPQEPNPVRLAEPQHTFFFHNADANTPGPNWPGPGVPVPFQPPANYGWRQTNSGPVQPFDWLVHLDRKVTSPLELLHVSGFRPHELTQQFINTFSTQVPVDNVAMPGMATVTLEAPSSGGALTGTSTNYTWTWTIVPNTTVLQIDTGSNQELVTVTNFDPATRQITATFNNRHTAPFEVMLPPAAQRLLKFNHRVPWFDESRRLYRFFEFVQTRDRSPPGTGADANRVPGRVNINTIWDAEILRALCDPQNANHFTQAQVNTIFNRLLALRTPGGVPAPNDRPFMSLAAPFTNTGDTQYPNGAGISDTLLRAFNSGDGFDKQRLFEVLPQTGNTASLHPYQQYELLTKIFNNATTRSNVFAVWMTVGYFEVDDTGRLGAEIGRAGGTHKRHRFFAIVDRSAIDFYRAPNGASNPYAEYDPRRDYSVQTASTGRPNPLLNGRLGPRSPILYWTIIE